MFIDGSGGDIILTDSEVLAAGSLNGFLNGKHYNRCKRLHTMLALAFHALHFEAFLKTTSIPEELEQKLKDTIMSHTCF